MLSLSDIRGLIDALRDIATALDRQTAWDREKYMLHQKARDLERDEEKRANDRSAELAEEQNRQVAAANDSTQRLLAQRAAWEETEREHMKVCAKRFEQQQMGRPIAEPVRH